jgi:glycosyltransferase involved in cell wall biosynthesis
MIQIDDRHNYCAIRVVELLRTSPGIGGLEVVVRNFLLARPESVKARVVVYGRNAASCVLPRFFLPLASVTRVTSWRDAIVFLRATDVVHIHAPTLTYWPRGIVVLARLLRVPIVLTFHLPSEPARRKGWVGRRRQATDLRVRGALLEWCRVRCVSPSVQAAEEAARRFKNRVYVSELLNGVPEREARAWPPSSILEVAFVGRLSEHKNPLLFMEVLRWLASAGRQTVAHVVGDGPLRAEVEEVARELEGSSVKVEVHGFVEDPASVLSRCHLHVMVSRQEGCPTVAVEAACLGRPTMTRLGLTGMEEILGEQYIPVPAEATAADFGAALQRAANELSRLEVIGRAARNEFDTRGLSAAAAACRWVKLYRELHGDGSSQ